MKTRSRSILILSILFGYIILQFLAWEIMFVRKTSENIELKQRLAELNIADAGQLSVEVEALHHKKKMQIFMIVGEGTVFLLLVLFGIYKIKQSLAKEMELSQQQKNFFLSITHELKTPIAATKLQLQTVQKHQLDAGQQKQLIANAITETERLETLINNLLLANRLDSGEFTLVKEKVNISELTQATLQRYFKKELASGELRTEIEPGISVEADRNAFPSILINLVDNALKYSFDEKNVTLTLSRSNGEAVLTVSDNGIGIAEEEREKIFGKFYRAGNEETRRAKGTGLGLFIVSYLAQKHGAAVKVKANEPKGSRFEIRFHAA